MVELFLINFYMPTFPSIEIKFQMNYIWQSFIWLYNILIIQTIGPVKMSSYSYLFKLIVIGDTSTMVNIQASGSPASCSSSWRRSSSSTMTLPSGSSSGPKLLLPIINKLNCKFGIRYDQCNTGWSIDL